MMGLGLIINIDDEEMFLHDIAIVRYAPVEVVVKKVKFKRVAKLLHRHISVYINGESSDLLADDKT